MRLIGLLVFTFVAGYAQAKMVSVHAGALFDSQSGKVLGPHTLNIENGKIVSVVKGKTASASNQTIDLSEYTVLPGLMDMHVHLDGEMNPKAYLEGFTKSVGAYALTAAANARKTLMAGFTTVRDLGDSGRVTIDLRRSIEKGESVGPRLFVAGKAIGTTGGHADPSNGRRFSEMDFPGPEVGVINGASEARAAVRQRYKEGSDVIKITATGGVLSQAKSGRNPQFMMDELKAIISTANDYGFTVAAHAHGKAGMLRAVNAGVTSIEHGTFMDDEVMRAMKRKKTYYVPTILAGNFVAEKAKIDGYFPEIVRPKAASVGPQIQKTFAKAYKAGVKIAFGTDSGVSAHGDNAKEFGFMVEAGMPASEAIQSATLVAAKLLKQEQNLGSLEVGKWADLIAVQGDPTKNVKLLENIPFVMKNGEVYKNETKKRN